MTQVGTNARVTLANDVMDELANATSSLYSNGSAYLEGISLAFQGLFDMGMEGQVRWLTRVWTDENSETFSFYPYEGPRVNVSKPVACLIRYWELDDDGYVPRVHLLMDRYTRSDCENGLMCVHLPSDWNADL